MEDIKAQIFNKAKQFGKFDVFMEEARKIWTRDIDGVARIYTRDKNDFNIKVCSLKNGGYAIVNKDKEIIYKNNDLHLCKVEWIMLVHY